MGGQIGAALLATITIAGTQTPRESAFIAAFTVTALLCLLGAGCAVFIPRKLSHVPRASFVHRAQRSELRMSIPPKEFEREIIKERTKAGLEAARARGRTGGRPQVLTDKQRDISLPEFPRILGILRCTGGGTRTHTPRRGSDFESLPVRLSVFLVVWIQAYPGQIIPYKVAHCWPSFLVGWCTNWCTSRLVSRSKPHSFSGCS